MKKKNRIFAVLGLGVFGSSVAKTLAEHDCEVIAVDKDPTCVERVADYVSSAVVCDITNIEQLKLSGVQDCDLAFICTGNHLEESVIAIINLKELKVPKMIAKAKNKRHMQIYKELGVAKVVRPEKEMGEQVAKSALGTSIIDLIDLDDEHCIIEIPVSKRWIYQSIVALDLRKKYKINIIGIRHQDYDKLDVSFNASYILQPNDHLVIICEVNTINELSFFHE